MEALMALGATFLAILFAIMGIVTILLIVSWWLMFNKAGQPGWAAIIPIYNLLILIKISGKPWWWIFGFVLAVIPFLGSVIVLVTEIIIFHGVSKNFGKDAGFTVGLILLPFIFFPILAFGDSQYNPVEQAPAA